MTRNESDSKNVFNMRNMNRYFPEKDVARALGVVPRVIGQLADTCVFNPGRRDVGLGLRNQRAREMIPTWTRFRRGSWEYSAKAVRVLMEYKQAFPSLVAELSKGYKYIYNAEDLLLQAREGVGESSSYPTKEQSYGVLRKLQDWARSRKLDKLKSCPSTSEILTEEGIELLANLSNELRKQTSLTREKELRDAINEESSMPIPTDATRAVLYRINPVPPWSPCEKFGLTDRVMSLRNDEGLEVGELGCVIGIHKNESKGLACALQIDVLLDKPNPCAGTLSGRCPESRGVSLAASSLLNLSRPPPQPKPKPKHTKLKSFETSAGPIMPRPKPQVPKPKAQAPRPPMPSFGGGGGGRRRRCEARPEDRQQRQPEQWQYDDQVEEEGGKNGWGEEW